MDPASNQSLVLMSVAQSKASLRDFATRSDEETFKPLAKHLALAGAGLAVASVVFGKTRSLGNLLAAGLRVVPLVLKFL
jgi:hypothetical protein